MMKSGFLLINVKVYGCSDAKNDSEVLQICHIR
jgi:hypothetical protein